MARLEPIIISQFKNISPRGFFWVESFAAINQGNKSLMAFKGGFSKLSQKGDTGLTNLDLVEGFTLRRLSSTDYLYAIDANGFIYRTNAIQTSSWAELRNPVPVSSQHPGIMPFTISGVENLMYTTAQFLCKTADDVTFVENIDLGASQATWYRGMFELGGTLYIGNGNDLASFSRTGVLDTAVKTFPEDYYFRTGESNGDYALISVFKNGRSLLLMWDGVHNYTKIHKRENIVQAIVPYKNGWIFWEDVKAYFTDGYRISEVSGATLPGLEDKMQDLSIHPEALKIVGDNLLVGGGFAGYLQAKKGVWAFNLKSLDWRFFAVRSSTNDFQYRNVTIGALYFNTLYFNNVLVGYITDSLISNPNFIGLVSLNSRAAPQGILIFPFVIPSKRMKLKELIINWMPDVDEFEASGSPQLNFTLRISENKEIMHQYGETTVASSDNLTLVVDGTVATFNHGKVGDEIVILSGINGGLRRHIKSIANPGATNETYTLDSAMNGNTEIGIRFNIMPFKLIQTKKTLTDYKENKVKFNLNNLRVSNNLLVELEISHTRYPISITSIVIVPSEVLTD
ncbi:hypothetical protein MYX07_00395 [Patescibacteria group bacterium AH-259-L07]|nr:hypothetical protein [Patescibacteria group bacterium AH-259-L07]